MTKNKKQLMWILILMVGLFYTGCTSFSAEEAMQPPAQAINDSGTIDDIFSSILGEDYRIANLTDLIPVYTLDFTGDQQEDMLMFYENINEPDTLYGGLFVEEGNGWHLYEGIDGENKKLDRVEFADLDENGQSEIYVSWQIDGSRDYGLEVYRVEEGALELTYSDLVKNWVIGDLIGEGHDSLIVAKQLLITDLDRIGTVEMIDYDGEAFTVVASCEFDPFAYGPETMIIGKADEHTQGLFLDYVVGAHSGVTDLIIYQDGELNNVFFDVEEKYTNATFKPYSLYSKDVNGDGIIEIGIHVPVFGQENESMASTVWMISWYQWDGQAGLKPVAYTYENYPTGFAFHYPDNWDPNKVEIEVTTYDDQWTFGFIYHDEGGEHLLFTVKAYDSSSWKEHVTDEDVIDKNFKYVFTVAINEEALDHEKQLTSEAIKNGVQLIEIPSYLTE